MSKYYTIGFAALALVSCTAKQDKVAEEEINDSTTPLHLLQPDYTTPYGQLTSDSVKADIDRVFAYIDAVTPAKMTDGKVNPGTYRLTSYEWGVMYDALLDAAAITGDKRYADYVSDRIGFLAAEADKATDVSEDGQLRQVKDPARSMMQVLWPVHGCVQPWPIQALKSLPISKTTGKS